MVFENLPSLFGEGVRQLPYKNRLVSEPGMIRTKGEDKYMTVQTPRASRPTVIAAFVTLILGVLLAICVMTMSISGVVAFWQAGNMAYDGWDGLERVVSTLRPYAFLLIKLLLVVVVYMTVTNRWHEVPRLFTKKTRRVKKQFLCTPAFDWGKPNYGTWVDAECPKGPRVQAAPEPTEARAAPRIELEAVMRNENGEMEIKGKTVEEEEKVVKKEKEKEEEDDDISSFDWTEDSLSTTSTTSTSDSVVSTVKSQQENEEKQEPTKEEEKEEEECEGGQCVIRDVGTVIVSDLDSD